MSAVHCSLCAFPYFIMTSRCLKLSDTSSETEDGSSSISKDCVLKIGDVFYESDGEDELKIEKMDLGSGRGSREVFSAP